MKASKRVMVCVLSVLASDAGRAQSRYLLADRTNDGLYRIYDGNSNDVIDEPAEVSLWFDGSNAAGTIAPSNPSALAVRRDGLCFLGDQGNGCVYRLRDLNGDGDALDAGESLVAADATNAAAISFAFPTGVAFDRAGVLYAVNAGNAFGNDGVYRCEDLNNDGDFQDAGEITPYVGEPYFGPGNGPYSPQELFFDAANAGYLRNSSVTLQGVIRFRDGDNNGRADDAGEATIFLDSTNVEGVAITAGFAIDPIPGCASDLYALVLASGGVDQLVRAVDNNNDGDAQDAGEIRLVWSNNAAGFTSVDIYAVSDREVLVTDNSGKKVFRLFDADNDGLFAVATEQTEFFANDSVVMGDVRQIALLPCPGDLDGNSAVELDDLAQLLSHFGTTTGASAADGDGDGDCDVDLDDLAFLLAHYGRICG